MPAITNGQPSNPAILQPVIGVPIAVARLSQESQREAGFLGLQYLCKAGYDPQAAIANLKSVEAAELAAGKKQASKLSPSAPAADRIKTTSEKIALFLPARANSVLNTPEFDSIKKQTTQSAK